jgi:O-antigen/teichoic acid export membrane protein
MALLPFIGGWFGIPREYIGIAVLYCTVIPTMQAMTPGGVLRTLDRFDLFSWGAVGDPIVRAVLAGLAWAFHAPFEAYVAIWWATDLGGDLYMWWLTHRELRRRGMRDALRPVLNPHPLKGAWRFAIRVNLSSSLSAAWGPIARLIVGGLLGPASAAFYRVAATLSDSAQKPTDMLARAFYPEIMRMDPRTRRPWKLMLRGAAVAAIIGIVALLLVAMAGDLLIDGIFGSKFDPAYPVLAILVIAPVLGAVAFPFEPMLYRLDRSSAPLKARIVATIVYFAIVAPLSLHFEVEGAAAAFVIGNLVFVGLLGLYLWGQYRQIRAGEVPPASAPLIDEQ